MSMELLNAKLEELGKLAVGQMTTIGADDLKAMGKEIGQTTLYEVVLWLKENVAVVLDARVDPATGGWRFVRRA